MSASFIATRPRLYWTLQLAGWGLWDIAGIALVSIFGKFSGPLVVIETIVAGTFLGLSHGLRLWARRHGWVRLPLLRLLPRLLGAIAVVVGLGLVIVGLLTSGLLWLWRPHELGGGFPWMQYVGYAINLSFAMGLWAAIYFGLHYLDHYRSAEVDRWKLAAAAREAELRTLQAQLNPHFLFNGLNNIRALVMEDPARARTMMTHLAELLRYAMQRNGSAQVTLATELEIVENYLQLEAMQLEERLDYTLDVPPDALPVRLPPMTLQLLVENAIKHGLAPRPAGGRLALGAQFAADGRLHIAVRNTGHYAPPPGHSGVGVRNVRERLGLLFGPAATFSLGPDPLLPDTVLAELRLPAAATQPPTHERLTN